MADSIREDVTILRDVADHLDPRRHDATLKQDWLEAYADDLRRIAMHLERIATGSDIA